MTAMDVRRRLGITFGEILRGLADRNLPLPVASTAGREADLARARAWLFPRDGDV